LFWCFVLLSGRIVFFAAFHDDHDFSANSRRAFIQTFAGSPVCSVAPTRNRLVPVSSGIDGVGFLWVAQVVVFYLARGL
jgi:hypothetical protein